MACLQSKVLTKVLKSLIWSVPESWIRNLVLVSQFPHYAPVLKLQKISP